MKAKEILSRSHFKIRFKQIKDEGEDHESPIDFNGTLIADHEATKIFSQMKVHSIIQRKR